MSLRTVIVVWGLSLALGAACAGDPDLEPTDVSTKYQTMFEAVEGYVNDPERFVEGEWQEHWGDGALFGPLYDLSMWRAHGVQSHYERAIEALEVNRARVEEAAPSLMNHLDNFETLSMSLLSIVKAGEFLEDSTAYREAAEAMMVGIESVAELFGDYIELDAGEFATSVYGPTAMTAAVATLHVELALNYPDYNQAHHLQRAGEILDEIHSRVWDEEMSVYRFAPGDTRLMLYPNATVMLALARAYELTGESRYLQRFEATFQGIQGLKDPDGDHYHSPYSAQSMGAEDEDYTTHSSQNYLMLSLLSAYQATDEAEYLVEIDTLLGFLKDRLLVGEQIMHHWMNGRAANEEDRYDYCLGCNVQTLFLLLSIAWLGGV